MSHGGARPGAGKPKGHARPPGSGRQKGTPNKRTLVLGEQLDKIGWDLVYRLHELRSFLEPKDEATVCLKLLEFVYPKLKAIEITLPPDDSDIIDIEDIPSAKLLEFVKGNSGAE